jgi:hypothetical protein
MQEVIYTIYWLEQEIPLYMQLTDLVAATEFMESLRKDAQASAIAMNSEHKDQVGKAGVDSIKDGVCPDGVPYDWVKRRDAVVKQTKTIGEELDDMWAKFGAGYHDED